MSIANCYNAGDVTNHATDTDEYMTRRIGGLIGRTPGVSDYNSMRQSYTNCFNVGAVTSGDKGTCGALFGILGYWGVTAEDLYYLTGTADKGCSWTSLETDPSIVKTAAEFASADFVTLLNTNSGSESAVFAAGTAYPIFSWQSDGPIDDGPAKNENGAYQLTSVDDLLWFADKVNNGGLNAIDAVLMNDIDLSSIESWTPIGTSDAQYSGTFDGQGHAITGMTIKGIDTGKNGNYLGFFGYAGSGAVMKNLTLDGSIDGAVYSTDKDYTAYDVCIGALVACVDTDATISDVQSLSLIHI